MQTLIVHRLRAARDEFSGQDFLILPNQTLNYAQAWARIDALASSLEQHAAQENIVGVLADRTPHAYLATLSVIHAAKTYVSLTAKNPVARLRSMVQAANIRTVFVCEEMEDLFFEAFADFGWPIAGIATGSLGQEADTATKQAVQKGGATLYHAGLHGDDAAAQQIPESENSLLYILFTSGSTGAPKGVPISNGNVAAYLDYTCARYGFGPTDRLSQTFELSFDLSVHDMLCAWTCGAAVVPITGMHLLAAARFIQTHEITCWFSVPSQVALMAKARSVREGAFPSLRLSLFCGEALPQRSAEEWAAAAPNSVIENIYGPTEATIAITAYRWDDETSAEHCRGGLVPIGQAFDGQRAEIFDDNRQPVSPEETGELMLGGSQLFNGYWNAQEITDRAIWRDESGTRWYRTGDLAQRDADGCLHFVGRLDSQIKFRGHRIELGEIEHALRKASGTDFAVVLPWPKINNEIQSLTAVLSGATQDDEAIGSVLKDVLPPYMVPERIVHLDEFPTNLSGKVDRKAIVKILDERV